MSSMLKLFLPRARLAAIMGMIFACALSLRAGQGEQAAEAALADTNSVNTASTTITAQDSVRSFLEIQEQLHNTQAAIEKNRHDTESSFATNIQLIKARLDLMDGERLDALTNIQHSNRVMLIASGVFVALGFLVLLTSAVLQLATIRRLAAVTAQLPAVQAHHGFGLGDGQPISSQALEQTNARLLSIIDRLEKRILEIESGKPAAVAITNGNGHNGEHHSETNDDIIVVAGTSGAELVNASNKVKTLMGKGQTLLKLDKAEEALACLDEVLSIDPAQLDALIKKGAALERLQRFPEAIACYDMAIARDGSMTMAYLYKGAVFNRMERYSEALECYEQALKSRQKKEQAANVIFDEA